MTVEDEKGYEIAEKYLRKKYGDDYVDFFETEGQSYLDGRAEEKRESELYIELLQKEKAELKKELYNLRQGVLMILHKNCTNRNEMYQDLERLYNGE